MRIYSMTATFGKLSHQTLTLQPGLNIIEAPNEWGKSTWCAFLIAMLYGIDTRQQTTKAGLADKERFAPWSGEPMSGRMELCWNGQDITIERTSKGRIPFGNFSAYETATGIAVEQLTAANCGQLLLGVERNVFTRSGFIRLQDMPVTQDDALRRRLNNLVTTGDESGAGDTLGQQLKELKNKCRYNRSGLLPQAEYEKQQLRDQLEQYQQLQQQISRLKEERAGLEQQLKLLDNHADALRYETARQGRQKLQEAKALCQSLEAEVEALQTLCQGLPEAEAAQLALEEGKALQQRYAQLSDRMYNIPQPPALPEAAQRYPDTTPQAALEAAQADYQAVQELERKKKKRARLPLYYGLAAVAILAALAILGFLVRLDAPLVYLIGGGLVVLSGVGIGVFCVQAAKSTAQKILALYDRHPGLTPSNWVPDAESYGQAMEQYNQALSQYQTQTDASQLQKDSLMQQIREYAGQSNLSAVISSWEETVAQHTQLHDKSRRLATAREHYQALLSVATNASAPDFADSLTLSEAETENQLQAAQFALRQTELKLGQCLGQAETLGQEDALRARLDSVSRRIHRLEEHYRALELAQEALYQASTTLQRRFAPRISKRAQGIFAQLTGGRYQRINLSDDLSMSASAENEDTLRAAQWRSDGTVDQLYLALRLAVAGELTPQAPLVLDDALLRYDDQRLAAALALLQQEATDKQVILFTCQSRENQLLNNLTNRKD